MNLEISNGQIATGCGVGKPLNVHAKQIKQSKQILALKGLFGKFIYLDAFYNCSIDGIAIDELNNLIFYRPSLMFY